MHLIGISSATPVATYSQKDCWDILCGSAAFNKLRPRSQDILKKVLLNDNGIQQRHFAFPDIENVFDQDAEALNRAFEKLAPELAEGALTEACEAADMKVTDLDGLIVATCTGYICPGISSHLAERIGLPADRYLCDLVGHGCGAALPTLQNAYHFLAANPDKRIAAIQVEVCSAAFYLDNDVGVLISLCLFGDGAAASIWTGGDPRGHPEILGFENLHLPQHRDLLRFENKRGKLRNLLDRSVPEIAGMAVAELNQSMERRLGSQPDQLLAHPGGRDVINAIEEQLSNFDYSITRSILAEHGNMSSPSVIFALKQFLKNREGGPEIVDLTAFGAGFTAYMGRLCLQ
ncbi:MAG: stilbene synthase [Opitutales bacterium]|nr:stilbene synthase [Opitutales bacterium]